MASDIISGYVSISNPPYDYANPQGGTIYCVTNRTKSILVMIILTPSFFNTAYTIIRNAQYKYIYVVTPNTDMVYVSDLYNLWRHANMLQKKLTILTPDKTYVNKMERFYDSFIENTHFNITELDTADDFVDFNVTIDFVPLDNTSVRLGYDIILHDSISCIYFTPYATLEKIAHIINNNIMNDNYDAEKVNNVVDQIHMPLHPLIYGGNSYIEIVNALPKEFRGIIYANSLSSKEEIGYCYDSGIKLGGYAAYAFI